MENRVMRRLRAMLRDARGATAVEYGLICALIVIAMVAGLSNYSAAAIRLYARIGNSTGAVL